RRRAAPGVAKFPRERSRLLVTLTVEYRLVRNAFCVTGDCGQEKLEASQVFVFKGINPLWQVGLGRPAKNQGESLITGRRRKVAHLGELKGYRTAAAGLNLELGVQLRGKDLAVVLSDWISHAEDHL